MTAAQSLEIEILLEDLLKEGRTSFMPRLIIIDQQGNRIETVNGNVEEMVNLAAHAITYAAFQDYFLSLAAEILLTGSPSNDIRLTKARRDSIEQLTKDVVLKSVAAVPHLLIRYADNLAKIAPDSVGNLTPEQRDELKRIMNKDDGDDTK